MANRKISTTVKSGDCIEYNGRKVIIGKCKKVFNHWLIEFRTILSPTSATTEWITTKELNKRLQTTNQPNFKTT